MASRLTQTREITFLQLMAMALRTGLRLRGQHGRVHGCVRATFQVLDNIPTKYKVGIFATPATYQAVIRFSSGPQAKDSIPGAQGMAIKLVGVPGHKILKKQADAVTHDFILLDFPVFFVRDTDSYARLVSELARLKPDQKPEQWLEWLGKSHPGDVAIAEKVRRPRGRQSPHGAVLEPGALRVRTGRRHDLPLHRDPASREQERRRPSGIA